MRRWRGKPAATKAEAKRKDNAETRRAQRFAEAHRQITPPDDYVERRGLMGSELAARRAGRAEASKAKRSMMRTAAE
jgi:hypothetical protein